MTIRQSGRSKRSPAVDWEIEAFEAIKTIDACELIDTNWAIVACEASWASVRRCERFDGANDASEAIEANEPSGAIDASDVSDTTTRAAIEACDATQAVAGPREHRGGQVDQCLVL